MQIHNQITKSFEKLKSSEAKSTEEKNNDGPQAIIKSPTECVASDILQKSELKTGSVPSTQSFVDDGQALPEQDAKGGFLLPGLPPPPNMPKPPPPSPPGGNHPSPSPKPPKPPNQPKPPQPPHQPKPPHQPPAQDPNQPHPIP